MGKMYHAFLSHSHIDADWVEELANKLKTEYGLDIWLDKWILKPGDRWIQEIDKGLSETKCCVVCIGSETPTGWFLNELEIARKQQVENPDDYRLIPVILPGYKEPAIPTYLDIYQRVDFSKKDEDQDFLVYSLVSGIKREEIIAPWERGKKIRLDKYADWIIELKELDKKVGGLPINVLEDTTRDIVIEWWNESRKSG